MRIFSLFLLIISTYILNAQVITSTSNPVIGTVLTQSGAIGFDTNQLKKTGVNQDWDFKAMVHNGVKIVSKYSDSKSSTYSSVFPESNVLQETTNQSDAFLLVNNSGSHFIGGVLQMPGAPNGYIAAKFRPVITFFDLPMQLGNKGNATTSFFYNIPKEFIPDSILNSIPFQIDSFRLRIDITRKFNCIGNGTIHLPQKDYPVVQMDFSMKPAQKFEVKVPIFGWIDVSQFIGGGQFSEFIPTTEGIYFLSPNHIGPVAVFNRTPGTETYDMALVDYEAINSSNKINDIIINTYPNPANDLLFLDCKKDFNEVKVFDDAGNLISIFKGNNQKLDISELSKGIYFINILSHNKLIGFSKFIKM